ncbi:hypothetical protein TanjilG_23623 [Lupinus angustifolius]|uniref:RING-type E3 ubiquitin transferase n=2 Tax=Lupinus angustifolius TaxID=3871 RepID=A0A4P1R9P7_LUPAN|nr:hypothetical protein TanjilG_23623 [Lupinus angustifolius]
MELYYNRRILLLNEDLPYYYSYSTSITPDIEPPTTTTTAAAANGSASQLPPRPIFNFGVAYYLIIILSFLLFLTFFILYMRRDHSLSHHPPRNERVVPTASITIPAQQVEDCVICLEEFREGENVKMILCCKHVFHPHCIDTWLDKHVTCPVCRCNKFSEVKVADENGVGTE